MKDDGCEHVKCIRCYNDFSFCCGAKRSPSSAHGNHFHRSNCFRYNDFVDITSEYYKKYFAGEELDEYLPKKCSECKRLGHVCKPPRPFANAAIGLICEEEHREMKELYPNL